ncbi:MAG TPA: alpha/beta hydrolase [Terriglobales bacterium]|nr:alpha/beta hydrolase [Terriglobales bacterium]
MAHCLTDLAYGQHARQVLDLVLPDRPNPRLFVFIHGGGWRAGDKSQYRALGELLANFGYAVALPNHRFAPEFPYPAALADVAASVAWVMRYAPESGIRPDAVLLGGHSSGAHLASLLALHPEYRQSSSVAGVISISGVYDLQAYAQMGAEYLGPVFGDESSSWSDASPLSHVFQGAPPFFLAHAEFDYPGAGPQAESMAAALRAVGSGVKLVNVPGRNHVTILTGVASLLDPLALGLAMFLRAC